MLLLALDTSTPAVTAGVVRVDPTAPSAAETLVSRVTVDARAHAELLTPHVREVLRVADLTFADVDAIVCGTGPGPFTGLRVGMVTAAALGHALDRPVHGVCSLDAIARDAVLGGAAEPLLVVTDARRREVYWAAYDVTGRRVEGPAVLAPADLAELVPDLGVRRAAGQGAELYADVLGLPVTGPTFPSAGGLAALAAPLVAGGPGPFLPLYLRRPDAVEPAARKKVGR